MLQTPGMRWGKETMYNITILPKPWCLKSKTCLRKIDKTYYQNKRGVLFLTLVKCMSGLKKKLGETNQKQNKKPSWRTKKQLGQEELGPIKLCKVTSNFVCQLRA